MITRDTHQDESAGHSPRVHTLDHVHEVGTRLRDHAGLVLWYLSLVVQTSHFPRHHFFPAWFPPCLPVTLSPHPLWVVTQTHCPCGSGGLEQKCEIHSYSCSSPSLAKTTNPPQKCSGGLVVLEAGCVYYTYSPIAERRRETRCLVMPISRIS
jgi:hypothetical protein